MKISRLLTILGFFALPIGCISKTTDVSTDPIYKGMIGNEFITKMDTVAFSFPESKGSINLDVFGTTGLPNQKDLPATFPFEYYDRQIHGVLPQGSTFRIVKVSRWKTFEDSGIDYMAVITSKGPFQGKEMEVTWLAEMTYYPNVPKFNPKYVEPVQGK
jgi:hypothetical protein